jgi:hypothetical protein
MRQLLVNASAPQRGVDVVPDRTGAVPRLRFGPVTDDRTDSPTAPAGASDSFVESLMDTDLYSMGAFFCDQHPDLVDEVVERSGEIERAGLTAFAAGSGISVEEAFGMLLTGLSVRYYKAVAG